MASNPLVTVPILKLWAKKGVNVFMDFFYDDFIIKFATMSDDEKTFKIGQHLA